MNEGNVHTPNRSAIGAKSMYDDNQIWFLNDTCTQACCCEGRGRDGGGVKCQGTCGVPPGARVFPSVLAEPLLTAQTNPQSVYKEILFCFLFVCFLKRRKDNKEEKKKKETRGCAKKQNKKKTKKEKKKSKKSHTQKRNAAKFSGEQGKVSCKSETIVGHS